LFVLGTDLVYVPRVITAWSRFGTRFLEKLLTPEEIDYCIGKNPVMPSSASRKKVWVSAQKLSARIAAKEAATKALSTGLNGLSWGKGVDWKEIIVKSQDKAAPALCLAGKAQALAQSKSLLSWCVSLSHDGEYTVATVIGFSN
jgi:holo-[acyl-carrier protein] synthase